MTVSRKFREVSLAASKAERIALIMKNLRVASPFVSGQAARDALEAIMKSVEDEFSDIAENPNAATDPPDGRMYPPHDSYELASASSRVRVFKMRRHRTLIGDNGSLKIVSVNSEVEIDLQGADGRTVDDLFSEAKS